MNGKKTQGKDTPFCTVAEAARRTGLSMYFFRNGIRDGSIPHIRSGRSIFVDLEKWREMRMQEA